MVLLSLGLTYTPCRLRIRFQWHSWPISIISIASKASFNLLLCSTLHIKRIGEELRRFANQKAGTQNGRGNGIKTEAKNETDKKEIFTKRFQEHLCILHHF